MAVNKLSKEQLDAIQESLSRLDRELSSHNETITTYDRRVRKAEGSIKGLTSAENVLSGALDDQKEKIDKIMEGIEGEERALKGLEKAYKKGSLSEKKFKEESERLKKSLDETNEAFDKAIKVEDTFKEQQEIVAGSLEKARKNADNYKNAMKAMSNTASRANELARSGIKTKADEAAAIKKLTDLRIKDLKAQLELGAIKSEGFQKGVAQAEEFATDIFNQGFKNIDLERLISKALKGETLKGGVITESAQEKAKEELKGRASGHITGTVVGVKSLFQGKGSGLTAIGKNIKGLQDMGRAADGLGKNVGGLKVAFKGLGVAMKAVGTAGWFGLIISAVGALVKFGSALDEFIKKANQSYFEMQGPITSLTDLGEKVRNFTDTLYNSEIKMKYGVNAEEVKQAFSGFKSSGMSLGGIEKSIGSYNEALEKTIVLSRTFGVGLSDMGGMISDQMLNLKSSLDEVSDSFSQMSYDATVAGVSSNRFYQEVMNVSSGLSRYGSYLKSTSGHLTKFMEEGITGFKDAAKDLSSLSQTMGNMDDNTTMKFMSMLGGMDSSSVKQILDKGLKYREEEVAKAKESLNAAKERLKSASGADEKKAAESLVASMEANLKTALGRFDIMKYSAGSSDPYQMGRGVREELARDPVSYMQMLAGKFGGSLSAIGSEQENVFMRIKNVLKQINVDSSVIDSLRDRSLARRGSLKRAGAEELFNIIKSGKLGDDIGKKFGEFKTLFEKYSSGDMSKEDYATKIKTDLEALKAGGANEGLINSLLKLIEDDATNIQGLITTLEGGGAKGGYADFITKLTDTLMVQKTPDIRADEKQQKNIAAGIGEMTNPLSKYVGIGKEQLRYALASSDVARDTLAGISNIATNTGGIFNIIQSWFRNKNKNAMERFDKVFKEKYTDSVAMLEGRKREIAGLKARQGGEKGLTKVETKLLKELEASIPKLEGYIKEVESVPGYKNIQGYIQNIKTDAYGKSYKKDGTNYTGDTRVDDSFVETGRRAVEIESQFLAVDWKKDIQHEKEKKKGSKWALDTKGMHNDKLEGLLKVLTVDKSTEKEKDKALNTLLKGETKKERDFLLSKAGEPVLLELIDKNFTNLKEALEGDKVDIEIKLDTELTAKIEKITKQKIAESKAKSVTKT